MQAKTGDYCPKMAVLRKMFPRREDLTLLGGWEKALESWVRAFQNGLTTQLSIYAARRKNSDNNRGLA